MKLNSFFLNKYRKIPMSLFQCPPRYVKFYNKQIIMQGNDTVYTHGKCIRLTYKNFIFAYLFKFIPKIKFQNQKAENIFWIFNKTVISETHTIIIKETKLNFERRNDICMVFLLFTSSKERAVSTYTNQLRVNPTFKKI